MVDEMRAVVVRAHGGPEVLELATVPVPPTGPGEVRVAVRSIGLNFRDVHQRRVGGADVTLPLTPGSDFAGEVVETGAGVETVHVGDRVFGVTLGGAYAEQVVAPAATVLPLPAGVDFDQAASLPVAGLSASFLLTTGGVAKGQTAVVWAAAGGLGCFLGGLLAMAGVRSIGMTSSDEKAAVARAAGHDDIVNYRQVDPVDAVHQLTEGRGADVVFDSVAGPDFGRSFRMLRNEGTVVLCGRAAGEPDLGLIAGALVGGRRNLALREFYLATHIFDHLDEMPTRLQQLADGLCDGTIHVPITAFALDDVAQAHELLESGRSTGKLVLRVPT
jgi:NADPH2:quinone reductase